MKEKKKDSRNCSDSHSSPSGRLGGVSPFDEIRPYLPEELPQVFEELIADPMFKAATAYAMPGIPYEGICTKMRQCKTNLDFQKAFFYGLLKELIAKCGNGIEMDAIVKSVAALLLYFAPRIRSVTVTVNIPREVQSAHSSCVCMAIL